MNTPSTDIEDDGILAGEYVLGVLDGPQRTGVERRIATEPAFAGRVAAWERHFAAWLDAIAPSPVPGHVWLRIRQRVGWAAVAPAPERGVWRNVAFWRGATALAAAAAIAAVYLGRAPLQAPPAPDPVVITTPEPEARPVTVLATGEGATSWIASVAAARDSVLMVPVPSPADPEGRVGELWIIPPGGAPLSLGLVSREQAHTIAIPPALRDAIVVGATFAVSLETEAGIPHAAPSGPIVATGQLESI